MKKMKRIIMISFLLFLFLFAACTKSSHTNAPLPAETAEPSAGIPNSMPADPTVPSEDIPDSAPADTPEAAATAYMKRYTDVMYIYTDDDLRIGTVAELDDAQRAAIPLQGVAFVPQAAVWYYITDAADKPVQIADEANFLVEKAEFYKLSRIRVGSYKTYFKSTFSVDDIATEGDFARVSVTQHITMRFKENAEPTEAIDLIDVILYRHEGRWLVLDMWTEDPVDEMKGTDFSAQDWIANLP